MTATLAIADATTRDAFLGGAVEIVQPARGHHRSGMEAVLLASTLPRGFAGLVVDLGAGAGVAGMCAAAIRPLAASVLVERDPELVECARTALELPANRAFAARVRVVKADIGALEAAGMPLGTAGAVLMNPPFYAEERASAPRAPARAAAHVLADEGLGLWFRAAAACLKPGGIVLAIGRAADLAAVLTAMAGHFGAAAILPVTARQGREPHRIIVRALKGAPGDTAMLPPLVIHAEAGHTFRPQVDRLLLGQVTLDEIHPAWHERRDADVDR